MTKTTDSESDVTAMRDTNLYIKPNVTQRVKHDRLCLCHPTNNKWHTMPFVEMILECGKQIIAQHEISGVRDR